MTGFIAFLQALPRLLWLMERIGQWVIDRNLNSWLDQVEQTIDSLEKAQTPEEKRKVARDLVGLIRSVR